MVGKIAPRPRPRQLFRGLPDPTLITNLDEVVLPLAIGRARPEVMDGKGKRRPRVASLGQASWSRWRR